MAKKSIIFDAEELLHTNEFKRTPLRVLLLEILHHAHSPLTVAILVHKTKKLHADTASVYRALLAFTERALVRVVSVQKGLASYELTHGKAHTHHIICSSCGTVETVPYCVRGIHSAVAKKSRYFKTIRDHTLQFSGTCKKCIRAVR